MKIDDIIINEDLETILNDLVVNLRANGIEYIQKMKPTNTHVQICCPYHNGGMERRPSMGVRKTDGICHCFACGEVHTLPELISHCFGKDDTGLFGLTYLLKNYVSVQVESRKPIQLNYTRDAAVSQQETFVSEEELDSYRYTHPYMYKRKLTDEVIELFDIGYDKNTDCITFPNRDINGNCVFVARRSVQTKFFSYPEGVEKPVYGLYEIKKLTQNDNYRINITEKGHQPGLYNVPEIIICESMLDALTCWVYGKPAVALNGLGTPQQFETLRNFPCRKYILATDADEYGLKARKRIREGLKGKIVTEYLWDLSIAKDINDMEKPYFLGLEEYF